MVCEWIVKADFIVRKDSAYRRTEFDRRREIDIDGEPVVLVSPEDLILSKLHWGKDSGSELQRRDVEQLLQSVEDLDENYLKEWASELGVLPLLEQLRAP